MARPIPDDAPVTMATLSFRRVPLGTAMVVYATVRLKNAVFYESWKMGRVKIWMLIV